jgi:transposase
MKNAVQIGSFVMIYKRNFIKIGSDIQQLIGRIHRDRMEIAEAYFRKAG